MEFCLVEGDALTCQERERRARLVEFPADNRAFEGLEPSAYRFLADRSSLLADAKRGPP